MKRYHINPETGRANICSVTPEKCKFGEGTIHGDSKEEVRQKYEEKMKSEELTSISKVKEDTEEQTDETSENTNITRSYMFLPHKLEKAIHSIEKANRRLEKAGIEERFEYETESKLIQETDENGFPVAYEAIKFTLNKPSISVEGSKFLAVVVQEEAGTVIKSSRDVELGGWRPESLVCDKCGQNRTREKTYIIEDKDGTRMQVGSSCVSQYLGISPKGLWALEYELDKDEFDEEDEFSIKSPGEHSGRGDARRPVNHTLSIALAVQEQYGEFVSKRYADMSGKIPTARLVEEVIYGGKAVEERDRQAILLRAEEIEKDGSKIKEIKDAIEEMETGTDYADNMKVIAKGEWASYRNNGLLISSLAIIDKKERVKKEKIKYTPGFTAPEKAKITGVTAKIISSRIIESSDFRGNPMSKTQIVFQDEEGHQMVWFASRIVEGFEDGDIIRFSGGSVKKHGSYNDIDQTVLTRVKFDGME